MLLYTVLMMETGVGKIECEMGCKIDGEREDWKERRISGGQGLFERQLTDPPISRARRQSSSWLFLFPFFFCRNEGASESPSIQPPHFYIALSRLGSFQVGHISAMGQIVANGRAVSGEDLSSNWLGQPSDDAMWDTRRWSHAVQG